MTDRYDIIMIGIIITTIVFSGGILVYDYVSWQDKQISGLQTQNKELAHQLFLKDDSRFSLMYLKVYEHFDMFENRTWVGYVLVNPSVNASGYYGGMFADWYTIHSPDLYARLNNSETYLATVDLYQPDDGATIIDVTGSGIKDTGTGWTTHMGRYLNVTVAPTY